MGFGWWPAVPAQTYRRGRWSAPRCHPLARRRASWRVDLECGRGHVEAKRGSRRRVPRGIRLAAGRAGTKSRRGRRPTSSSFTTSGVKDRLGAGGHRRGQAEIATDGYAWGSVGASSAGATSWVKATGGLTSSGTTSGHAERAEAVARVGAAGRQGCRRLSRRLEGKGSLSTGPLVRVARRRPPLLRGCSNRLRPRGRLPARRPQLYLWPRDPPFDRERGHVDDLVIESYPRRHGGLDRCRCVQSVRRSVDHPSCRTLARERIVTGTVDGRREAGSRGEKGRLGGHGR